MKFTESAKREMYKKYCGYAVKNNLPKPEYDYDCYTDKVYENWSNAMGKENLAEGATQMVIGKGEKFFNDRMEFEVIDINDNYALLFGTTRTFQPYVVAWGLQKDGSWNQGHYFNDLDSAKKFFRKASKSMSESVKRSVRVGGVDYPIRDKRFLEGKLIGNGNVYGLEHIMNVKAKDGSVYKIYDTRIGVSSDANACAIKVK